MLRIRAVRLRAMRDAASVARPVIVPLAAVDAPHAPQHAPVGFHSRLARQRRSVEAKQQAVVKGRAMRCDNNLTDGRRQADSWGA